MVHIPIWKYNIFAIAHIIPNSGIIPLNGTEIPTRDTFAVLDDTDDLVRFTASLKTIGKRLVIDSLQDLPFQFNSVTYTTQNYISPSISQVILKLTESRIYERWELLKLMRDQLVYMDNFGEGLSKKLILKFSSDFGESNVQMYNSEGEAFPALFYVFGLCATVIAMAVLSLLVECRFAINRFLEIGRLFMRHLGSYMGYLARCAVY